MWKAVIESDKTKIFGKWESNFKAKNSLDDTSKIIADDIQHLVSKKCDCLIVHFGTINLNYQINTLDNVNKNMKNVQKLFVIILELFFNTAKRQT